MIGLRLQNREINRHQQGKIEDARKPREMQRGEGLQTDRQHRDHQSKEMQWYDRGSISRREPAMSVGKSTSLPGAWLPVGVNSGQEAA